MPGPEGDKELWQAYTAKVKPAAVPRRSKTNKSALKPAAKEKASSVRPAPMPVAATGRKVEFVDMLDRRKEKQMRDGSLAVDAKLDMHGMTQAEAYHALEHFMAKQIRAKRRNLLIVTGKGRDGEGVLRANLVSWLRALPCAAFILSVRSAAIRHGGSGAFYVIMRRFEG